MPDLTTTIKIVRSFNPCVGSYKLFLKSLKTHDDNTQIKLSDVLKICGIEDACWFLRCFEYKDYCLFCADVAESVLPIFENKYQNDDRPRKAILAIREYHRGKVTKKELNAAAADADAAAYAYADAAADAADADAAAYAAYAAGADAAYAAGADAYAAAAYAAAAYAAAYAADADAAAAGADAAYAAGADAAYAAGADAAYAAAAYAYAADAKTKQWGTTKELLIKFIAN